MAWISVHESIYGPKLRHLTMKARCSEDEAVGILNRLWFWGLKNADKSGKLMYTTRRDVALCLASAGGVNLKIREAVAELASAGLCGDKSVPEILNHLVKAEVIHEQYLDIVDALIDSGWIDDMDGVLSIHDWSFWQKQWYQAKERREKDAQRKRDEKKKNGQMSLLDNLDKKQDVPPPPEEPKPEPEKPEPPKKKPKPKKQYAEFVKLAEDEYQKLVEAHGELFTARCIEILDNYKGANKKKYDSDYRAILSWVVDRVKEREPGLRERSLSAGCRMEPDQNPFFEEMGELQ